MTFFEICALENAIAQMERRCAHARASAYATAMSGQPCCNIHAAAATDCQQSGRHFSYRCKFCNIIADATDRPAYKRACAAYIRACVEIDARYDAVHDEATTELSRLQNLEADMEKDYFAYMDLNVSPPLTHS